MGMWTPFLELGVSSPFTLRSKHFCGCRRADSCNRKTPFHKCFYTHTHTHRVCRNDTHGCARFAAFFFWCSRHQELRTDSTPVALQWFSHFLLEFGVLHTRKEKQENKLKENFGLIRQCGWVKGKRELRSIMKENYFLSFPFIRYLMKSNKNE